MQMAPSASCTGSEGRSASLYATTASMPSVRQARRMRRAISPRLAMRMRENIRAPIPAAGERPPAAGRPEPGPKTRCGRVAPPPSRPHAAPPPDGPPRAGPGLGMECAARRRRDAPTRRFAPLARMFGASAAAGRALGLRAPPEHRLPGGRAARRLTVVRLRRGLGGFAQPETPAVLAHLELAQRAGLQ